MSNFDLDDSGAEEHRVRRPLICHGWSRLDTTMVLAAALFYGACLVGVVAAAWAS